MVLALKGFLIGFAIAPPVKPTGIVCILRTLAEDRPLLGFYRVLSALALTLANLAPIIVERAFHNVRG